MLGIVHTVLVYAGFSALWILLSDRLVTWAFTDPDWIALVSTLKGWLFVLVTSLLLLALLRRVVGIRDASRAADVSRLPGLGLAPLALVIVVIAGFSVSYTLTKHRDTDIARLQGIAGLMAEQVAGWLADREEQAEFIKTDDSVTEDYYRWQGAGDPASGVRLLSRLAQLRLHRGFSDVVFLDPEGHYLWSTGDAPPALAPELRVAVNQAARDGKVHRVGPYLDGKGLPRLDFVAAFPPSLGAPPIVVLRTDPTAWLYSTLQNWPVPSRTGETLLLRRDEDGLVFLNQLRFHSAPMLRVQPSADGTEFVAEQLLRGKVPPGQVASGVDYRGVPVLGVARGIAGTDWVLVAKTDRSELWEQAGADVLWVGLASLLAFAAAIFGARLLRQREQLAVAEGIQESQTERLRALDLLAAIADASDDPIFAKDREGRYTLLNRAAGRFVGKSAEEVLGRDDRAVFPAEQAEMLMAKDRELIAGNKTQTVEEVLTTIYGKRVFLVTKGPLRDTDGKVLGVFGIARDITDRKGSDLALRESESRFRALVEQSLAGIYIIQDGVFQYANQGFAEIFGYESPEAVIGHLTVAEFVAPEDFARVQANIQARLDGTLSDVHYAFSALRRNGERVEVEVHGRASEYRGRPAVIGLLLDISVRRVAEEALRKQAEELARRNAELERFNRAVVGRELDMLLLKQQINSLSHALGREQPFTLPLLDTLSPSSAGARV